MVDAVSRSLLLIDDEPAQVRLVTAIAARAGWRTTACPGVAEAEAMLGRPGAQPIEAILLDRWDPGPGAGAAVSRLRSRLPGVPILVLTAQHSVANAVEAMRAGASDYLVKPIAPDRLLAALDSAGDGRSISGELRPLAEKMSATFAFGSVIGNAPGFRAALDAAQKAARSRVPILIEGEGGVGKEVFATAIHAASPSAEGPLVTVNCAAIAGNLIESELFGHERGAFTGAFDKRRGKFDEAAGGTLFLDEIGALPLDAQVKLLRVLQSGEIHPLGSRAAHPIDVRIIAATNRLLHEEVAAGQFREDLYYRLNVVHLTIPPLRERTADLPQLARHLLSRMAQAPGMRRVAISDEALALLMDYRWPGNVRQLQNALFRAALGCERDMLGPDDFPQIAQAAAAPIAANSFAQRGGVSLFEANGHMRSLDAIEADVIRLAITHYRGRMTEVARRLGIGRSTLYRKLAELGIDHAAA